MYVLRGEQLTVSEIRKPLYLKGNKKSSVNEVQLRLIEKSPRFLNNYNVTNIVFFIMMLVSILFNLFGFGTTSIGNSNLDYKKSRFLSKSHNGHS